ncbi:MAG: DUF4065 domain-containing protein [Mediterranea sp.]|nr:DUF4065 domain-containing protein [Mediterranea sp.]
MATKEEVEAFLSRRMKSPFTAGEAVLCLREEELLFRKESFSYVHLSYQCVDTKEEFTTTEIDEVNLSQVYNQYRVKYGIPFADEIKGIRQLYELSASKMSKILGFGENQYRLYENGDMPSETNGKILSSIKLPSVFETFVMNARNQFEEKEYEKIQAKLHRIIENEKPNINEKLIFASYGRGALNGYAAQSYGKLQNTVLYFLERCGSTFTTKMNKLLFYADFLSYKTHGQAITGLGYKAIQHGPVPVKWDRVYSLLDDVLMEEVVFLMGNYGTRLCSSQPADEGYFSPKELTVLDVVASKFKETSAVEISDLSHAEDAWLHYHDGKQLIDYKEAFTLKGISAV